MDSFKVLKQEKCSEKLWQIKFEEKSTSFLQLAPKHNFLAISAERTLSTILPENTTSDAQSVTNFCIILML